MIGRHILADLWGVPSSRLDDAALLSRALVEAARASSLTPVNPPVIHRFPGGGVTGFLLLSESHIAFHSYPERGFLALDVFSCGRGDPERAVEAFRALLAPARVSFCAHDRGRP